MLAGGNIHTRGPRDGAESGRRAQGAERGRVGDLGVQIFDAT